MDRIFREIPKLNIKRGGARSIGIIVLIAILSLSLVIIGFISLSMKNGLNALKDRMGADIIILPKDEERNYEGALLNGDPSAFHLQYNTLDKVKEFDFVTKCSPQLYMATLSAGCCAFPVQVIGIDFDSDFSVAPWLKNQVNEDLNTDEIYAGRNITSPAGGFVDFYEHTYFVKEKLEETGMGFDNSVFMSIEDARLLAEEAKNYGVDTKADQDKLISCIMVNVESEDRIDNIVRDINKVMIDFNAKAYASSKFVANTAKQIEGSFTYIKALLGIIIIMVVVVLLIIFPLMIKSRSKELMVIRILGSTKKQISNLLFKEIFLLSSMGASIGGILGFIISILFSNTIEYSINNPFLKPKISYLFVLMLGAIFICALVGPLVSLFSIKRLNSKEIAIASTEND